MKKDGTLYLALVKYENNTEEWTLISWRKPAALSDVSQREGWVQGGFRLKIKKIIQFFKLDDVIRKLQ